MPNYANGKIYSIRSYSNPDLIYIGSTTQTLSKRLQKHKSDYKCFLLGKFCYVTSYKLIECDDCYIELIEKYDCNCKEELNKREGYYIRKMECVNKNISGRTKKEYYEKNKEKIKEKQKQYREKNKEKIKQYYEKNKEKNKDKIKEYNKQYREKNKEKIKEYYEKNKEKIKQYDKQY